MRKDLAQLIVETPRHNTGEFFKVHRRKAKQDLDLAPTKQGMRRPYLERKEFGDYLSPLKGVLRKNVGRPWDKVFSELNSALQGGGTVVEHVKVHLRGYIELSPVFINGKPHTTPPYFAFGSGMEGPQPLNNTFYVDPHGILRHAKARPRKRQKPVIEHVKIDDSTAFHKIDGLWYRVWTKPLPLADRAHPPIYDLVLKKWVRCVEHKPFSWRREKVAEAAEVLTYRWEVAGTSGTWNLEHLHGSNRVAYRKESVSSRTIRREGLDRLKAA
jgi:hypothetical protein